MLTTLPTTTASAVRVSYRSQGFDIDYLVRADLAGARLLYRIARAYYPPRVASDVLRDLLNCGATGMSAVTLTHHTYCAVTLQSVA